MLGNVIEYYGFTVFAVFAAQIGKVFFPSSTSDYLSTLYALMLFGAGFITRPIGSIVFGHFGDKIGKGTYIYKLKVKSNRLNKQVEKIQKLVIL